MIPELGNFCLVLALLLSLLQGTLPLAGAARARAPWMAVAPRAAIAQALCVAAAFGCLAASFVGNDFSVLTVARNSSAQLPPVYRFAAAWGSHEGSLLLWTLVLGGWSAAFAARAQGVPAPMRARALAVLGWVSCGFLLFMLASSNPFARLFPAALQGRDLNPLLQDPGMALHPPLLYVGYAGFALAWALAMAGVAGGGFDAAHLAAMRRWAARAWACLTLGIALGSWWAYRELGWGGWWFWDPVENASLMPWLAGTALLHALAGSARRRAMLGWAVALAVLAFALSLLGTFLMRSGVLTSVHAFATDPLRGVLILGFVATVLVGSVATIALHPAIGRGDGAAAVPGAFTRESLLLANVLLLVAACASVLLGTLYPTAFEVLGLGRLSVGPPYFETVLVPILLPLALLAGAGALTRAGPGPAARTATVALVMTLAVALAWPGWSALGLLGVFTACWVAGATVLPPVSRRGAGGRSSARAWAMVVAHFGLAVLIAGVTVAKSRGLEQDVRLAPGEAASLGGLEFRLIGLADVEGPNFSAVRAEVRVSRAGRTVALLHPEKRVYRAQPATPMTEAAIDSGLLGDLYVSLGEPLAADAWTLRLQVKPLVNWIWAGCALMAAGGLAAGLLRRRS